MSQATFNKHVFAAEQQLYAQEGIAWREVTWPDNSACLALIAQRGGTGGAGGGGFTGGGSVSGSACPPGLLHLVDEMCRLPKCTDLDLNARLHDTHATHPHFGRPEKRSMLSHAFKVRHYAGEVTYSVAGFLAKNNDTLSAELSKLCAASACSILGAAFAAREEKRGGETAAREAAKTETRQTHHAMSAARTPALARSATTPSSAAPLSAAPPSVTGGGVHLPTPLTASRHVNSPRCATGGAGGEAGATPSVSKLSAWKGRSETSAALLTTPRGATPRGATPRGGVGAARGGGQRSFSSVGLTFIKQMNGMVADLDATRCNFVRCIKPSVGLTILDDGSRVFESEYVCTGSELFSRLCRTRRSLTDPGLSTLVETDTGAHSAEAHGLAPVLRVAQARLPHPHRVHRSRRTIHSNPPASASGVALPRRLRPHPHVSASLRI